MKNVFLINQNYSHGHQVSRVAKELLAPSVPTSRWSAMTCIRWAKCATFAPYIAKMRAANADTVITGNWGPDFALLVRAARDAGLNANFYTYYGGVMAHRQQWVRRAKDRMRMVGYWHPNITPNYPGEKMYLDFKKRFGEEFYVVATYSALTMLADAIKRTKSTDRCRSRMRWKVPSGPGSMATSRCARRSSVLQPYGSRRWTKVGGPNKNDIEKTGYTWKTEVRIETTLPRSRPAAP